MKINRTALEVVFAVLGSVCGTLITEAVQDSMAINLAGAAIGAAIPPFVSATGRYRHLRAATAVVVAFVALGITYSGAQIVSAASGDPILPPIVERTTVLPPPSSAASSRPPTTKSTTGSPTSPPRGAFDLAMQVKNAKCLFRQAGTSGKDSVRITFQLTMTGTPPAKLPVSVTVTAVSNVGATRTFVVSLSDKQQPVGITVPTLAQSTDFQHKITITADPDNTVREADETNNQVHVTLTIAAKATTGPPQCIVN
jgi:hypothetical protein